MTQPALPPAPISPGTYWYLMLAKPAEKSTTIEDVGKDGASKFKMLKDAGLEAAGIHNELPALRLQRYENGVKGLPGGTRWPELQQAFPRRYSELQRDFHRLAGRTLTETATPVPEAPPIPQVPQVLSAGRLAA